MSDERRQNEARGDGYIGRALAAVERGNQRIERARELGDEGHWGLAAIELRTAAEAWVTADVEFGHARLAEEVRRAR